jgi:hypothetical protein
MENVGTFPNPDLEIAENNMSRWSRADHRRRGFHNLHRIARYGCSFRSARVMRLEKRGRVGFQSRKAKVISPNTHHATISSLLFSS